MEEYAMPSSSIEPLDQWRRYKRIVDNVRIDARLVDREGTKMLEVKESRMSDFHCPNCKYLLTQRDTGAFPNFFLEPKNFHAAHTPLDPNP
ncbi:MAG: hypothetical protein KAJ19_13585 [Gammaproteobacteria bacterium]|nr:hypothetical protein [Gammaproteobacteria bacterium]